MSALGWILLGVGVIAFLLAMYAIVWVGGKSERDTEGYPPSFTIRDGELSSDDETRSVPRERRL